MDAFFFLVPISIIFAGGGLFACIWALRSGQYDDTQSPAERIVLDEDG
jgi:cbb3-type cytochrome oxidase maturation protein